MRASPLGLRLFLEGVEVPVISAQVTAAPDRPASAAIQIVPTNMGMHLLPRTLVHLFYLDNDLSDEEIQKARALAEEPTRTPPAGEVKTQAVFDVSDVSYKLLFSGEVIGLQYAKTPSSRQLVLQCIDLSSYWDTCYQFFAEYKAGGSGLTDTMHQFVGAGSGLFDDVASGHQWMMARILGTQPKSIEYKDTTGLLGGLIHLLETVGGLRYRTKDFPGYSGVNDFFTIAELRYNLLGMLGAIASDKTSTKLYAAKAFREWLKNGMTSLGNLVSFRDMLNHINRYIFHNIYPNPCAYYSPPKEGEAEKPVFTTPSIFKDAIAGVGIRLRFKKILEGMQRAKANYELSATYKESEKGTLKGSEARIRPEHTYWTGQGQLRDLLPIFKIVNKMVDDLETDDKVEVKKQWDQIKSDFNDAFVLSVDSSSRIPPPDEGIGFGALGPDVYEEPEVDLTTARASSIRNLNKQSTKIVAKLDAATARLTELLGIKHVTKASGFKKVKVSVGGHLYNQLFLPETYFVAPPRCNVIFPDQYFNFEYSRNFAREVTRLCCQGGLGMLAGGNAQEAQILGRKYFAPDIKDIRDKLLRVTNERGSHILLPHEVHSGIIPKFEWVTDGHRWGSKAAENKENQGTEDRRNQKINYIQRLANFQFYLHRWASRTMSLQGIFMPQLVMGFPSVVIDKPAPSPAVLAKLAQDLGGGRMNLPVQYLGKIMGLTHNVGQQGGQTAVSFSYCRTHRGLDDEFFGVVAKEVFALANQSTVNVYPKKVATSKLGLGDRSWGIEYLVFQSWAQGTLKVGNSIKGLGKIRRVKVSVETTKLTKQEYETLYRKAKFNDLPIGTSAVTLAADITEEEVELLEKRGFVKPMEPGDVKRISVTTGYSRSDAKLLERTGNPGFDWSKWRGVIGSETINQFLVELPSEITVDFGEMVATGKYEKPASFEDAVRPEWMSEDVWTNDKITEMVYKPLLGCTAITDDKSLGVEQQEKLLKTAQQEQVGLHYDKPVATEYLDEQGDRQVEYGEASATSIDAGKTRYQVKDGSVEVVVDGIAIVYGLIRDEPGANVHEFIKKFTSRPIATIVDVLGSQNLVFDSKGFVKGGEGPGESPMIEGFHSRAFWPYYIEEDKPLVALFPGEDDPTGVKRKSLIGGKEEALTPEMDPRKRAQERVRLYMKELNSSRGLLGT